MIDKLIITLAICTLVVYFWMKKGKNRLPPGIHSLILEIRLNSYNYKCELGPLRLPVLGSVIQILRANPHYPHLALSKLAEKYGDVMSLGFGMHSAGKN